MSTILKALKQAEKDCPDQENEKRPSFNVRTVVMPQIQQKASRFSNLVRAVGPLAVVFGVALCSYALFIINKNNRPQSFLNTEQPQVLDTKSVMEKGQTQVIPQREIASFDPSKPGNERALMPEAMNQAPDSKPVSKKLTENSLGPLDTDSLKKNKRKLPNPSIKQKTIPEDPALLSAQVPTSGQSKMKDSAKGEKQVLTAKASKQRILPLKNNRMKVQAISWDQSQSNRIAVIDNSVLREGDSVQGYRLVRIEKDSVILNYSGSEYRLGFRHR
jgi:Type II secretion system protein B